MLADFGLELLIGLDLLAIHREDDIPLAQTGSQGSAARLWRWHQYATFFNGRDRHEWIDVSVPALTYSKAA